MKGRSASKIKLTSYDELLGGGEEINDIQQVSLEHLHSFENHPFQVNDDEAMEELVESVKEEGILTALLVRPLGNGEYEIIAGHRRRHAAQLAGLKGSGYYQKYGSRYSCPCDGRQQSAET